MFKLHVESTPKDSMLKGSENHSTMLKHTSKGTLLLELIPL